MDKNEALFTLIITACIVGGIFAVLHELQPVLVQIATYTGIALVIAVFVVGFAVLMLLVMLFTERMPNHPGQSPSVGAAAVMKLIEQRERKLRHEPQLEHKPKRIPLIGRAVRFLDSNGEDWGD